MGQDRDVEVQAIDTPLAQYATTASSCPQCLCQALESSRLFIQAIVETLDDETRAHGLESLLKLLRGRRIVSGRKLLWPNPSNGCKLATMCGVGWYCKAMSPLERRRGCSVNYLPT